MMMRYRSSRVTFFIVHQYGVKSERATGDDIVGLLVADVGGMVRVHSELA